MSSSYHHGDLPAALRSATVELVAEKGTSGFSLREVARRAGVSHAAPAHHFGDAKGMLTSVAAEGFARLSDAMEETAVGATDAADRLRRIGVAYVHVALANPGHFAVMMQDGLLDETNESLLTESFRAFVALHSTVIAIRDELNPALDIDEAVIFCWSTIQGLVALAPNLDQMSITTGTRAPPLEQLVEKFSVFMLQGMAIR